MNGVAVYGHWGRPMTRLPSRGRRRRGVRAPGDGRGDWGLARRGTGEAVLRGLVRPRVLVQPRHPGRGTRPPPRRVRGVDPRPGRPVRAPRLRRRRRGDRLRGQPRGLPRRELRAQASRRVPAGDLPLGQLRPVGLARLGRARRGRLLQQPDGLRRPPRGRSPRLAALRSSACCWCAGRGSGRTRPARSSRPAASPGCSRPRASGASSTCGGTTSPTIGPPGARNSPITCHASADARRNDPPDRPAARHRGGLADARSRRWSRGSGRSPTPRATATGSPPSGSRSSRSTCATARPTSSSSTVWPTGTTSRASGSRRSR